MKALEREIRPGAPGVVWPLIPIGLSAEKKRRIRQMDSVHVTVARAKIDLGLPIDCRIGRTSGIFHRYKSVRLS